MGTAWCLPGKGKGHSLCESPTVAQPINEQVTFLAKPRNTTFTIGGKCLQYNLRECLPPDEDINSRETGLNY